MKSDYMEIFEREAIPQLKDLYRSALRLTRDAAAAEDVVQEVYLQAWKSFDSYEPGTNCRAWLYRILFFKISQRRRAFAVETKFFQSDDDEGTLFANAVAPQPIAAHLTDENVIAAVDNLPANFRAVLLLADVEEFDYKEIAVILQIPIGTVMSRLSRARKQLRNSLAASAGEYGLKIQPKATRQTTVSVHI